MTTFLMLGGCFLTGFVAGSLYVREKLVDHFRAVRYEERQRQSEFIATLMARHEEELRAARERQRPLNVWFDRPRQPLRMN